ncbi:MAG: tubulin-like doman-containing protein [Gemmataceae bacterium]
MAVRVEQHAEPIPGYRLIERLGGGGFGEVWRAEAPGGLQKAIKFVYGDLSSGNESDQRARQEWKALERVKSVRHPYILSLERYEVIDGKLIIVMELADRNLWDRYKECRGQGLPGIPREELLRYMAEAAEALDLMNREYQLQHLDIKPQNLFLIHNHIKVADFGLVKDMEGSQASVTGGITPVYAAPETFDGKVSRFSDQYSLAIVIQELLTGQRPFNGTNVRQLILQHISAEPNLESLPPSDRPILARALAKSPNQRFPSCLDLIRALLANPEGQPPPNHPGPIPPLAPSALSGVVAGSSSWQSAGSSHTLPPPTINARGPVPDTGSNQGATHSLRAVDQAIPGPSAPPVQAPPEIKGPGILFPALVIGMGQMGLSVLQRTREILLQQVAPLSNLPQLRYLLIDTDPEVMRLATKSSTAALGAGEVLLAPLNRPSYYVKPREGRPSLDAWLNQRILYRIPRSQVTTGVRALGRLAFVDHYRTITRRLHLELETILEPQALQTAARQTGLGIRSNRPRIYLLCNLGGGTGSGMLFDVAYNIRALLHRMGYDSAEIIGLLMLPHLEPSRTKAMTLGNTYAALTELDYYGRTGTAFTGQYVSREPGVTDRGPPFSRVMLMPMPEDSDETATQEVIDLIGQTVCRELASSVGRVADLARSGLPAPSYDMRGQYGNSFSLCQVSWPRQSLVKKVSRQLCLRIIQRWATKDAKPLQERAAHWVQEQWVIQELGAESFIHRVQSEITRRLGKPAESAFAAISEPFRRGSSQGDTLVSDVARGDSKMLLPANLEQILGQYEKLVGGPTEPAAGEEQPELMRLLREVAEQLTGEWSQKLAEITVNLIEDPTFRLAGAEEAIRQLVATLEQVLQHHEPLARDLAQKANEAHASIRALLASQTREGKLRTRLTSPEILELVRHYPKWRFQSLILQHLATSFVSLRGHLSDELREVNFCRVRLGELQRLFEEQAGASAQGTQSRPKAEKDEATYARQLFPAGCQTIHDAVEMFLATFTSDDLLELDGQMEHMLRKNFTALVHVCLTTANVLKNLSGSMMNVAQTFVTERMPPTSIAELFFEHHGTPEECEGEIVGCFDEADPEITVQTATRGNVPITEFCVLATPQDDVSEEFRQLAVKALPQVELHVANSQDDILFYRERINLPLADLEHMGPVARDAYFQMSSTDHFTAHIRCDIDFRSPPTK